VRVGNFRQRPPIRVRGKFVEIGRVGATIILLTTAQLYITHADWVPPVDDIAIARIRELYALGDLSLQEIADRFDVSQTLVWECVRGERRFAGLSPIPRPPNRCGRRNPKYEVATP